MPGRGEVRVRVSAAGLNRADILQRRGLYPAPPGVPADIGGIELAGVVDTLGPGATSAAVGDLVMAVVGGGAFAEFVLVPEAEVLRVPRDLSLELAAAIPEAFATAYDALVVQAGLTAGQTVVVHAAASGVGLAAAQLARAVGARCVGTTRTAEKTQTIEAFGAEPVALAGDEGWEDLRAAVGPGGAQVVLDLVGGSYVDKSLSLLSTGGVLLVVGLLAGARAQVSLGALLSRRARIIGTVLRSRRPEEKAALARLLDQRVVPLFERGVCRPTVSGVLPFEAAGEAHAAMESNSVVGKLVLSWGATPQNNE
jgi:putative PIG3 family NAD(P)H quinone oxidoreductase